MRYLAIFVITGILSFLFVFLSVSFVNWELLSYNPGDWKEGLRGFALALWVFAFSIIAVVFGMD